LLQQPQLLMAALTSPGAQEVFDMGGLVHLGRVVLKMLTANYLLQVSDTGRLESAEATVCADRYSVHENRRAAAAYSGCPVAVLGESCSLCWFQGCFADTARKTVCRPVL
jgi:hypothetical protein